MVKVVNTARWGSGTLDIEPIVTAPYLHEDSGYFSDGWLAVHGLQRCGRRRGIDTPALLLHHPISARTVRDGLV